MSDELLKQIIFDCAMELIYEQENLPKEVIGNRLLDAIRRHDDQKGESK